MADDFAELARALRARLNEAELGHARACARIWVTDYAPEGSMLDVPYLDDQGLETGERQLLVHPNDWTAIEALASQWHDAPDMSRPVIEAYGVPVVKDHA